MLKDKISNLGESIKGLANKIKPKEDGQAPSAPKSASISGQPSVSVDSTDENLSSKFKKICGSCVGTAKNCCVKVASVSKKTKILILVSVLVLAGVGAGLIWYYKFRTPPKPLSPAEILRKEEDNIIWKGSKPVVIEKLSNKETGEAEVQSVQIKFHNFKESEVQTLDLDENYKRIVKKYLAVQIEVFNPSTEKTENLIVGLKDDRGNQYRPDSGIAFYIMNDRFFGLNMSIFPRVMQDGFLYFTDLDEEAESFELVFAVKSTGEKIAFKFDRNKE